MPQNSAVDKMMSDAKAAMAHANTVSIPAKPITGTPTAKPIAKPVPVKGTPKPTVLSELAEKQKMEAGVVDSLPKMHKGGTVKVEGGYHLKAGEHVLTAPEAMKARKHAIMASGMKSLASPAEKAKSKARA